MFSYKKKLDCNLKYYISNNAYKNYRVLIQYKDFQSSIVKKINSYKGTVHHIIESANLISAELNSRSIDRISEYPEVCKIYLDEYLFLCGMSVTAANKIHFSESYSLSGTGIGIGLIDSGIFPHPDLTSPSNKIELFEDLINNFSILMMIMGMVHPWLEFYAVVVYHQIICTKEYAVKVNYFVIKHLINLVKALLLIYSIL